mmetsp:Transcript_84079/g.168361  ORF Transcript_84079/g.168361 Transcript_84079/m.168361 type:complete len:202 (-) Transcript_84079:158-763(-)
MAVYCFCIQRIQVCLSVACLKALKNEKKNKKHSFVLLTALRLATDRSVRCRPFSSSSVVAWKRGSEQGSSHESVALSNECLVHARSFLLEQEHDLRHGAARLEQLHHLGDLLRVLQRHRRTGQLLQVWVALFQSREFRVQTVGPREHGLEVDGRERRRQAREGGLHVLVAQKHGHAQLLCFHKRDPKLVARLKPLVVHLFV